MNRADMDNDLLEFNRITMKLLLNETKYKLFFTQSEFQEKYGEIMNIYHIHDKLQKKYKKEDF